MKLNLQSACNHCLFLNSFQTEKPAPGDENEKSIDKSFRLFAFLRDIISFWLKHITYSDFSVIE